jgi:phospholipase C
MLYACGRVGPLPGPPIANLQRGEAPIQRSTQSKIQHIVIIIQENRSFNNLFYGYPGAKTASYGYNSSGQKIELQPVTIATTWDLQHNAQGYMASCHGKGKGKIPGTDCRMNGFDNEKWYCGSGSEPKCPNKSPPYSYVPQKQTAPYFSMAQQYVLADRMYASDFDISSFISHQYIIAGVNPDETFDYPDGGWGCAGAPGDRIGVLGPDRNIKGSKGVFPCWNPTTLGDELDKAGLPWSFYAVSLNDKGSGSGKLCGSDPDTNGERSAIWSAYQAIKHICYGKDWNADVKSPPQRFLSDVKGGNLAAVTWVTPTYANSDHGGNGSDTGPSWVSSLVNAVGESQFWSSSAIFIFWDDPGGWYDPEPPAYIDNDGLGYRLPLLIISPYARKGYVSHTHYEHGSILKFVEETFGMPALAKSDKRATAPADAFDFNQSPRKFVTIRAKYDANYFLNQSLDTRPPDTD